MKILAMYEDNTSELINTETWLKEFGFSGEVMFREFFKDQYVGKLSIQKGIGFFVLLEY